VSHARITAMTSMINNGGGKVPGLLAVLALVPDPRKPRERRYPLVFVLAVAAACTLAGAKTFREIGDQAADLPQNVLRDLGGKPHPLRRKVITPSETRNRTRGTDGSSAARSGSPTRRTSTSRTSGRPCGSAATATTPVAH
jgi:hypothetical protein